MNDIAISILSSLASSSGLALFVVWLSKSWITERLKTAIKHEYDQKFESFKSIIQAENNSELEKLRNELRMTAFEKETRFVKLHENRAKVIAELHAKLQDLIMNIRNHLCTSGNKPKIETIMQDCDSLYKYFRHSRIYLPDKTEEKLDKFCEYTVNMFEYKKNYFIKNNIEEIE